MKTIPRNILIGLTYLLPLYLCTLIMPGGDIFMRFFSLLAIVLHFFIGYNKFKAHKTSFIISIFLLIIIAFSLVYFTSEIKERKTVTTISLDEP